VLDTGMKQVFIVGLGGTTRPDSSSERAARCTLAEAAKLGARVRMFSGSDLLLPMYAPEAPDRSAAAVAIIDALRQADGIVLSSPGYHGSISGLLKNALDYTEDMRGDPLVYFERRVVGCIVCAAGWQAVGTTLTAMRSIVHALRGWPTPMGVGINTAVTKAFGADGSCVDPAVSVQLKTLAAQVVEFARVFGATPPLPAPSS
jgi:FMN reductase